MDWKALQWLGTGTTLGAGVSYAALTLPSLNEATAALPTIGTLFFAGSILVVLAGWTRARRAAPEAP